MSLTGDPDGAPTKSGLSLVDLSGGYVSALALLAGLHRARRDGVGCDADISLFETALHQLMYVGTWTASGGYKPRRLPDSAHPSIVPFQAFATADGWITIACAKQKFWERLCEVLDRRDLLADPRFADFARARAPSRRTRAGSRRDPALLHDPGSAEVVERQRFALLAPVAEHRPPVQLQRANAQSAQLAIVLSGYLAVKASVCTCCPSRSHDSTPARSRARRAARHPRRPSSSIV